MYVSKIYAEGFFVSFTCDLFKMGAILRIDIQKTKQLHFKGEIYPNYTKRHTFA